MALFKWVWKFHCISSISPNTFLAFPCQTFFLYSIIHTGPVLSVSYFPFYYVSNHWSETTYRIMPALYIYKARILWSGKKVCDQDFLFLSFCHSGKYLIWLWFFSRMFHKALQNRCILSYICYIHQEKDWEIAWVGEDHSTLKHITCGLFASSNFITDLVNSFSLSQVDRYEDCVKHARVGFHMLRRDCIANSRG